MTKSRAASDVISRMLAGEYNEGQMWLGTRLQRTIVGQVTEPSGEGELKGRKARLEVVTATSCFQVMNLVVVHVRL